MIGTLYSEVVAHTISGDVQLSADRLQVIEKELVTLRAPSALYNYVAIVRYFLESGTHSQNVLGDFVLLMQPFLEEFAEAQRGEGVFMFRAGTWLADLALAAAGEDELGLHQPFKLTYLQSNFTEIGAPQDVIESLNRLIEITDNEMLSESDMAEAQDLIGRIRRQLM